ncbi:MAG TPA: cyclic nucleotide-binding domain-containing protein [Spongiibacteraceae bacterium]|jgi:CRP-like cAMP-binding protein
MNIKEIRHIPRGELATLLTRIPFFKELRLRDEDQLHLLMTYCCLVELAPGETIMRRGQKGTWLYFLIKGKLIVYRDRPEPAEAINAITPGELFGDLAQLCDHQRKATVAASSDRGALLFACDFKAFGELENFSQVHLSTKLLFYRTVVHSIRWRLEVLRMEQPDHVLINELLKMPVFAGQRESIDELRALHKQAQNLAVILERWNHGNGKIGELFVANTAAAS